MVVTGIMDNPSLWIWSQLAFPSTQIYKGLVAIALNSVFQNCPYFDDNTFNNVHEKIIFVWLAKNKCFLI